MRFGLHKNHLDFFHQNHFIEFENLITEKQVTALQNIKDKSCYDSWRSNRVLQKVSLNPAFADIAHELTKQKKIRIAFDLFWTDDQQKDSTLDMEYPSSIQPLILGLALKYRTEVCSPQVQEKENENTSPPLSNQLGSGIFFLPKNLFHLRLTSSYFLIFYTHENGQYLHCPNEPYGRYLKKMDYVIGERIRSNTHPLLYPT